MSEHRLHENKVSSWECIRCKKINSPEVKQCPCTPSTDESNEKDKLERLNEG
jgi:hypothetical protein